MYHQWEIIKYITCCCLPGSPSSRCPSSTLYNVIQLSYSKGNQPWIFIGRTEAEAEAPILWPPDEKSWLTGKDPDAGKYWGQEEKEATEVEMVGWHHWLNGHEFEQSLGDRGGQRRLACCSSWGRRVRHNWVTERQQHWALSARYCAGCWWQNFE